MAFTLFDITYRVARELGLVVEGTVASGMGIGGTTTTMYDIVFLKDRYEDNYFNAGTLWVLYDAGGASAAPQGEWARITDFAKTTGIVTHTALTAATAAGDRYAIANADYTRDQMISAINQVLGEIPIEYHDDSTITTSSGLTEYTLPTALLSQNIEVWINTHDTTDDNDYVKLHDWYIEEEITGTAKKLIFRTEPPSPYHLRIRYWLPHTALYSSSDKLRESVDIDRVVLPAAYRLLLWMKSQKSQEDPLLDQRIAEMYARSEASKWKSRRKGYIKLNTLGDINL